MQAISSETTEQDPISPTVGEPPARAVSSLEGLISDSEVQASTSTTHENNNNHVVEEEEEEESDYEYEDEDDAAFGGFLEQHTEQVVLEEGTSKPKWKEPTSQAVNMSLRAEQESTGGKRRLASDLYKIMMSDTSEAGFSLEPSSEDAMDKWKIQLFQFDEDSSLAQDMMVLGVDHVELEMTFPDDYPFAPPFVRVVQPRFKRQTGFVMNGALCMELLTKDGWNPINDIESVIVSIRSLMVVGGGRLQAAVELPPEKYKELLKHYQTKKPEPKRERVESPKNESAKKPAKIYKGGQYSAAEAASAYAHISDYHKKKGWDTSGWWAKKG